MEVMQPQAQTFTGPLDSYTWLGLQNLNHVILLVEIALSRQSNLTHSVIGVVFNTSISSTDEPRRLLTDHMMGSE